MKTVMEFAKTDRMDAEVIYLIDQAADEVGSDPNRVIRVTVETVPRPIEVGSRWRGKDGIVRVVERVEPQTFTGKLIRVTYHREQDGWLGQQTSFWFLEYCVFIGYIHDEIQDP